jgi:restriction endonuclease S subunit
MKRGRIKCGDILVVKDGATTGKTATVRENFPFSEAAVNEHVFLLRADRAKVLSEFVGYFLFGPVGQQQILSSFHGAAIGGITQDFVRNVFVPVPPLAEQERIVKLLDEADELRKLRAQADHRTADIIPALFYEMFGKAEQNAKKWPVKAIGDVCTLVRGSSPRPKSDPRYYGGPIPRLMIEDITRDGWSVTPRVDSLTELGATMSRPVKAGTIVMAVSGNVGLCAQLAIDACVHDGFVAFKDLRASVLLPVFFGMAMSQMHQAHQRNKAGAIFQNITTTDVKAMKISVPPLSLQKEFTARVSEIRAMETEQAASRECLEALFQSLLHRAFNEEL